MVSVLRGIQNNTNLTSVDIQAPITSLNNSLFMGCTSLTHVGLPDTLREIETAAFSGCTSLTQIDLPEGLEVIGSSAFRNTALESITLPDSLTEIKAGAFAGLTSLKSVDFNHVSARIGDKAFQHCSALTNITGTEKITEIGSYAFGSDDQSGENGNVYVPFAGELALDSVTNLGRAAFKNCLYLSRVTGLDNVTEIPQEAFDHCFRLTGVTGLGNVTRLGDNAFANCRAYISRKYTGITELEGLELSNLRVIGASALASVQVPFEVDETSFANLESLGVGAFNGAVKLTGKLVLPESIEKIGENTFRATGITEAVLPDSVQSIGRLAFFNCKKLTSVQIGRKDGQSSRLLAIDAGAFANDKAITSFVIETARSEVSVSKEKVKLNPISTFDSMPAEVEELMVYTVQSIEGPQIYADDAETTLQTAIDNAENGAVITATRSFAVDKTVTVPAGKTVTLTDGGKNLTAATVKNFRGPVFEIEEGAALILDGTFTFKCHHITGGRFAQVNGSLTLSGGRIFGLASDSADSGVIYVDGGGSLTMNGGTITENRFTNQYSGAVVLNNGTMNMTDGCITANTAAADNASAGVLVKEGSVFTMDGGTISDGTGTRGAGVLVGLPGGVYNESTAARFVMNDGTISGNTANATTATVNAGGGGVFVQDNAEFTMNGGTITGNRAAGNGMGGGVATANEAKNDGGRFTMNGGTISNNSASCGGGVYSFSQNTVVLRGGFIVNNKAGMNGGGVYVSTPPYNIRIEKALVTGNTAEIMGGGIWSCPTGTVSLGTDSAVFGNTAKQAGDDLAFLSKESGYSSSFSGRQLGGALVTWYRDNALISAGQFGGCGNERFDAQNPGSPAAPAAGESRSYALKALVSADGRAMAEKAAKLFIQGNTAPRGGGIGTNGEVILDGNDTPTEPIDITVHKVWKGGESYPSAVTINLIRTDAAGSSTVIGTALLSEKSLDKDGGAWSHTFTGLDSGFTYSVSEETVEGYDTAVSGDAQNGFTVTNTKKSDNPGGGGGGGHHRPDQKPDPKPDDPTNSPVDIPDDPTPTSPLPPVDAQDIADGEIPTGTDEKKPEETGKQETVTIKDEVPTSSVPKTGDIGGLWAALCALSALGLAFLGRKKKHDDN